MKKQEIYDFIVKKRREVVVEIEKEIDEIEDVLIDNILIEVGFEEFHKNWKEQSKKRDEFVGKLEKAGLRSNWSQTTGQSGMNRLVYGTDNVSEDAIRTCLKLDIKRTKEIQDKYKKIDDTREEFHKLKQQVKLLSTAKKGYDLLIELGFNKEELDAETMPTATSLVVQNFDNNLLGLNKEA